MPVDLEDYLTAIRGISSQIREAETALPMALENYYEAMAEKLAQSYAGACYDSLEAISDTVKATMKERWLEVQMSSTSTMSGGFTSSNMIAQIERGTALKMWRRMDLGGCVIEDAILRGFKASEQTKADMRDQIVMDNPQ